MRQASWRRSVLVACLALAGALACGCGGGSGDGSIGGDAGVENGTIRGQVMGVAGAGRLPIEDAVVTAIRHDSPPITRFTRTDSSGIFVFTDMPLGSYTIAVQAIGFASLSAADSNAPQVFVESGSESDLPPITLGATFAPGTANLIVTVLDAVTGEPVTGATVSAGVSTAIAQDAAGVYTLDVPVDALASPVTVPLTVEADGYDQGTQTPATVTLAPGQLVGITARLTPLAGTITGQLTIDSSQGALLSAGLLSTVALTVANVPSSFSRPSIDPTNGNFSVTVPASTFSHARSVTLVFTSPNFAVATVTGLITPLAGSRTLAGSVVLRPIGVTVTGTVVNSSSQLAGSSPIDVVTIQELGIQVPIVNGVYTFANVPVGIKLTLQATAANPFRPLNPVETAVVVIQATSSPDGVFSVPVMMTH